MREVKTTTSRLEAMVADVPQAVSRMEVTLTATLPHLATKAELADNPGKAYLATLLAVLISAYAAGLAALAILN